MYTSLHAYPRDSSPYSHAGEFGGEGDLHPTVEMERIRDMYVKSELEDDADGFVGISEWEGTPGK